MKTNMLELTSPVVNWAGGGDCWKIRTLLQPDSLRCFSLHHDYLLCLIYAYEHAGLADGLISSGYTSTTSL